ncbi:methyltransferase domain-containing protein [Herbaspirillum sp. HC18]|nr:methyltransferase domain-containing protein [Herbaspirillum sp. HC18]
MEITEQEFRHFQRFIYDAAGITLPETKKPLVCGRLAKRLQHCHVSSYGEYFALLKSGHAADEVQMAVDLLTTNETYFFREQEHFDLLRTQALAAKGRSEPFRVWSAASSTGEEAFSAAMVLADCLGQGRWEVIGTDISSRVVQAAARAHYPMERASHIPHGYLHRFCLKGIGAQAGTLLIDRELRSHVRFIHANLNQPLPELGQFDVVFLRNVMIYFNDDTKRRVVARVLAQLRRGGHFFIGHSESLNGISGDVELLSPSIYVKQ